MAEKNFILKKVHSKVEVSFGNSLKTIHREISKEHTLSHQYFRSTRTKPDHFAPYRAVIEGKIRSIWQVSSMIGIEISEAVIIKYIQKTMELKCFHYCNIIFETIKTKKLPKTYEKVEEFKMQELIYEYDKIKKELQQFLWRRFCKDIEIMEERIKLADIQLRDHIELQKYKALTCSFRPLLVSTESNLVKEYYSINGNSNQKISMIQHLRYNKLAEFSQKISKLHNFVCKQKQNQKLFIG